MRDFLDDDFLLYNDTAGELFHTCAKELPILDYHCHIDPREIAEDRVFSNLAQVWLGGDHYKWRLMRANGAPEEEVTGSAPDRVKFQHFAEALPRAAGNPLYHWSHLELRRYFNCSAILNGDTAQQVWEHCNSLLPGLSARRLILQSHVEVVCTTDDPADDLRWHKMLQEDGSFPVLVAPAWRPDKAMNLEKEGFSAYVARLSLAAGMEIRSLRDLLEALEKRMDYFDAMGCRVSDHGLDAVPARFPTEGEAARSFEKALLGQPLSPREQEGYKGFLLRFLGEQYSARGWVMQLHYGALRNANQAGFARLGPDTGYDCIRTADNSLGAAALLDALEQEGRLPKTILYSLNPNDNAMLDALANSFQGAGVRGKVQHGAAWWFNDTKRGMEAQLTSLAESSLLGNFVGMLTDSRSFLSYARHEYFRRILCNLLGDWAERGELPRDMELLKTIVRDVCCENARRYFQFAAGKEAPKA
ncbi:MAG TPA: glucuronate isomerase [Candidatus Caccousia avistercoris]|nr:glucuronate isomerase [Candidatus Caccousia avistercoris]